MNDKRELLELAAKAAGYTLKWGETYIVGDSKIDCTDLCWVVSDQPDVADWHWNPLEDDGDALRLAVKLRMVLDVAMEASGAGSGGHKWFSELHGNDPNAATRLAIVKAAAEIGRNMK